MSRKHSNTYDANPRTKALRPKTALTEQQEEAIRKARKNGLTPEEIAEETNISLEDVNIALSKLRTPVSNHSRKTVNASVKVHSYIMKNRVGDESAAQALDRMLFDKRK